MLLFTNNATTTLASGIGPGATSISVATGTGALYPSPTGSNYFLATIQEGVFIEIVKVTSRIGDVMAVVRAQESTSATTFSTAAVFDLRLTAGGLNLLPQVVGTFSATPLSNGGAISGTTLTFGPADSTRPGMVSNAAQVFSGAKTFDDLLTGSLGFAGKFMDLLNGPLVGVSSSNRVRFRSNNGRAEVSENGGSWKGLTKEAGYYDIRDYGALPGIANKAATTAAFEAIFAEVTWGYFPTVEGKRNAVIYIPFTQDDAWYVDELSGYIGSSGAALNFIGDVPSGYAGLGGSVLRYDGPTGGTMLDLVAINLSSVRNITFHGGNKANRLILLRQYWNEAELFQVASNGVNFVDCYFCAPENEYDSILVAAGQDDHPGSTFQAADYWFTRCLFQGNDFGPGLTRQGWGFKTLIAGNTKNFSFDGCSFLYLHRGIETYSGYLQIRQIETGNIGYDRADSAVVWFSGNSLTIDGGGMENGNRGYNGKFCITSQGVKAKLSGLYIASQFASDDYGLSLGGGGSVTESDLVCSRSAASYIEWLPEEDVLVGQVRTNDGNAYVCITPGTTDVSGGPTGTGDGIVDGSAEWDFETDNLVSNEFRINAPSTETSLGWGGLYIRNCAFPYITTPIQGVPIYDGSNNPIFGAVGKAGTDYAKTVSHKTRVLGCSTGLWGTDIDEQLPDFRGDFEICVRDQTSNNYIPDQCTVVRNDSGVYIITVPASAIVFNGPDLRIFDLANTADRVKITEVIMDVTTIFSGPGVSGITAKIGVGSMAVDGLLLDQDVETVATYGLDPAERGGDWTGERFIPWSAASSQVILKFSSTGGSPININAGSLTITVETKRLGV